MDLFIFVCSSSDCSVLAVVRQTDFVFVGGCGGMIRLYNQEKKPVSVEESRGYIWGYK